MMIHYHPTLPRIDASGECGMHLDLVHWRGMGSAKVGSTNTTTQPWACCSDSLPTHMYGTGRIIGWWIGGNDQIM